MNAENLKRSCRVFEIFFRISLVTLGGGLAMLPMIKREFTERRAWIKDDEMLDCIGVAQSLPGILACNVGALVGFRIAGFCGAIAAILGSAIPPFFIIAFLGKLILDYRNEESLGRIFSGIRSASCAVILAVLINMVAKSDNPRRLILMSLIPFVLIAFFNVSPVWLILAALALSFLFKRN